MRNIFLLFFTLVAFSTSVGQNGVSSATAQPAQTTNIRQTTSPVIGGQVVEHIITATGNEIKSTTASEIGKPVTVGTTQNTPGEVKKADPAIHTEEKIK